MKARTKVPLVVSEALKKMGMECPSSVRWTDLDGAKGTKRKAPGDCVAVAISREISPREVVNLAFRWGFSHVVQIGSWNWDRELRSTLMLAEFLETEDGASPMDALIESEEAEVFEHKVRDALQKKTILGKFEEFLKEKRSVGPILADVAAILDEFYTNAIFNAPTNGEGDKRYADLHREAKPLLHEKEAGRLFVAYSPDCLVLGCEDPFGSLDPRHVLERLRDSYKDGVENSIVDGEGGAGIGLRVVFEKSASLYLIVAPGKRTWVASIIPLRTTARRESAEIKNIHVVVKDTEVESDE